MPSGAAAATLVEDWEAPSESKRRYELRVKTDPILKEALERMTMAVGAEVNKTNVERVCSIAFRSRKRPGADPAKESGHWFENLSPMKLMPTELANRAGFHETVRKRVAQQTKRLILSRVRSSRPSAHPGNTTAALFCSGPSRRGVDSLR